MSISGLVVEYIVAIDVTRVRFPADALSETLPGTRRDAIALAPKRIDERPRADLSRDRWMQGPEC